MANHLAALILQKTVVTIYTIQFNIKNTFAKNVNLNISYSKCKQLLFHYYPLIICRSLHQRGNVFVFLRSSIWIFRLFFNSNSSLIVWNKCILSKADVGPLSCMLRTFLRVQHFQTVTKFAFCCVSPKGIDVAVNTIVLKQTRCSGKNCSPPFLWYDTDCIENDASNSSSIVVFNRCRGNGIT
jgi:hypothetical protein